MSEASVMSNCLNSMGVPASRIIIEDRSTNTYENLKYSKGIIDKNKFKSVVIVSNDFHIYRSLRLARILGLNASGAPAPTVDYLAFYYNCREILSVAKSYVLYWGI